MRDSRRVGRVLVELHQGDITEQEVDAIVNAANERLAGGGGVDGAIHRAGGPEILAACAELGGCGTGNAKATGAGNLPARWVIHAVGPVWRGGRSGEAALLESAYRRSLQVAVELGATTVAFPALSAGAYGYPLLEAAEVALAAVASELERAPGSIEQVRFVLFDVAAHEAFRIALGSVLGPAGDRAAP